ncbi:MAG: phosphoglucomutase, alpha-D-glucose phosphate-specific, partial [Calditrichia bacterium]
MSVHPLAGKTAPPDKLSNIPYLVSAYFACQPDPENKQQQVSFGTSGHRGSSLENSFNENHLLAVCQAICDYRQENGIEGPLLLGKDTHALSEPAFVTAVEVFAANGIHVLIQEKRSFTPTPVISHAILIYNLEGKKSPADGVIITPSHNPPEDGGIKYNPPSGGPADSGITSKIEEKANRHLLNGLKKVKRLPYSRALKSEYISEHDFITPYVADLKNVLNMKAIAESGLKIGVDPMGGSGIYFWEPIAGT